MDKSDKYVLLFFVTYPVIGIFVAALAVRVSKHLVRWNVISKSDQENLIGWPPHVLCLAWPLIILIPIMALITVPFYFASTAFSFISRKAIETIGGEKLQDNPMYVAHTGESQPEQKPDLPIPFGVGEIKVGEIKTDDTKEGK